MIKTECSARVIFPHAGAGTQALGWADMVPREPTGRISSHTYRLLAPRTADSHDLFTVEGELLLEALRQ